MVYFVLRLLGIPNYDILLYTAFAHLICIVLRFGFLKGVADQRIPSQNDSANSNADGMDVGNEEDSRECKETAEEAFE